MKERPYIVCCDHPLPAQQQTEAYKTYLQDRASKILDLQRVPIPPGGFGFIVEVNTSSKWTARRPQLSIGSLEKRTGFRFSAPHNGFSGFTIAQEDVFTPYESPQTAYGNEGLAFTIVPIGWTTWHHRSMFRNETAHDPTRLHRHRSKKGPLYRRQGGVEREGKGITFGTYGEPLAMTTHAGVQVWPHMLVRVIGNQDFEHALAISYIGDKSFFLPNEARQGGKSICYEILFRPRTTT